MKIYDRYTCDVCNCTVHYPIPYPFAVGTGYLCHSCMRHLSTAAMLKSTRAS